MRCLALAALAVAIVAPAAALAQAALDPQPSTWRGVAMGPEQIFEGDYTVDQQTSVFKGDGAAEADWLAGWEDRPGDNGGITRRYHIRFIGRRTAQAGKYGSLGKYAGEVLITHLISARLLVGQSR
jgi:hypothetical protein